MIKRPNKALQIIGLDMLNMKAIESWFSKRVEKELKELASKAHSYQRVAIAGAVVFILILLYLIAHQILSTGFYTAKFGPLEMLLLYGSLTEWIIVAILEAFNRKDFSRDIDAFGGIIFVTIGGAWLLVVFPFEFANFADVLPNLLRFLLQWISNTIAWVLILLWTIFNLIAAVYYGILRVLVRKARAKKGG
jgi:hypothetical protein